MRNNIRDREKAVQAFRRAVEMYGAQYKLAAALGISAAAVSFWDEVVPAERVRQVSALTGIAPSELRPDLYWGMVEIHKPPITAQAQDGVAA